MIDRIKKLMDFKKLTATQFSDEIEIQRSSLSHVLSGRNKPSLDFMLKIKNTYPEINLDWLLIGNGEMIERTAKSSVIAKNKIAEPESDLEINFEEPEIYAETREKKVVTKLNAPEKQDLGIHNTIKKPVRVMLFYEDNTFEFFESNQ